MTIMSQPNEPPRHEHANEAERILMVDLAATQAQAKGVAPSANRKGGKTETTVNILRGEKHFNFKNSFYMIPFLPLHHTILKTFSKSLRKFS
jgi:hypothetical protein